MAKRNVTLQYFDRPSGRDGTEHVSGPVGIPDNRSAIMRLGWSHREQQTSWDSLATMVDESSLADAVFFVDSSFFDRHEIPWNVWEALLHRQVVFTPLVWKELEDWRSNPFANTRIRDSLIELTTENDPRVQLFDPTTWPSDVQTNAMRYAELLGCRKLVGLAIAEYLKDGGNSEPTREDITKELQKRVRDRGLILGRKGMDDADKPNFLADEQFVVCAIVHAVLTGRETAMLTRDVDLVEQFYKAIYLLDTDYKSLLVRESFTLSPDNLVVQDIDAETETEAFESTERQLLHLPRRFLQWVLPLDSTSVVVSCIRLGGHEQHMKASSLNFCAEREMYSVLERGVSDAEGNRCVICLSPPFAPEISGDAIIGKERHFRFGPWDPTVTDLYYALHEVEHFRHVRVNGPLAEGSDSLGPNLAAFRLEERLMFSRQPQWWDASPADIAEAIRYCDASAIVFCDQSFLMSQCAEDIGDVLAERRFATTHKIQQDLLLSESAGAKVRRLLAKPEKAVDLYKPSSQSYEFGYGYYLSLLAFRKLYGDVIKQQVAREYHRESPDTEWPQIVEHYAGLRGRIVAEVGERGKLDESLYYSDELLVQGFLASIAEGTDVVFLTCDPVFMDQFAKLFRHVRDHYLANRLGDRMMREPASYPTYEVASQDGRDVYTCYDLGSGWEAKVLPPNPYFLNMHCWLIESSSPTRCCPFTFCGERPMYQLLRSKGATGGLNVHGEQGRNLRIGQSHSGLVAILKMESQIQFGSSSLPSDDRLELRLPSLPEIDLVHLVNQKDDVHPVWFDKWNA